jgi:hypothetical protein
VSYWVTFYVDTGAGNSVEVDSRNYTSNVSGMWALALDLPEVPLFDETGEPVMVSRYDRDKGTWSKVQDTAWGLRLLDEKTAGDIAGLLRAAVERMSDPGDRYAYVKMEPDNGWGDYSGALEYLDWIARTAEAHPAAKIRVSA